MKWLPLRVVLPAAALAIVGEWLLIQYILYLVSGGN